MTFHTHDYFSSEDLDFRNLTKFSLHFFHIFLLFTTHFTRSVHKTETGIQLETGTSGFWKPEVPVFGQKQGSARPRPWPARGAHTGQGWRCRVPRRRRGGQAAVRASRGGGGARPQRGAPRRGDPRHARGGAWTAAAARRVPGGGGAGIEWGKGRGGRVDHGEAHHVVRSSGEGPEVVRRWKGGASVENVNGGRVRRA